MPADNNLRIHDLLIKRHNFEPRWRKLRVRILTPLLNALRNTYFFSILHHRPNGFLNN